MTRYGKLSLTLSLVLKEGGSYRVDGFVFLYFFVPLDVLSDDGFDVALFLVLLIFRAAVFELLFDELLLLDVTLL